MAERRMFHAAVVESDAFLDLPVGAQALYFHLGMQADDDGFVNGPRQIARKLRRPPRELQLLEDTGFLLNFDGIVVLKHWRMANNWKSDRLQLPRYPDYAKKIFLKPTKEYTISRVPGSPNLLRLKKKLIQEHGIQTESQKRRKQNKTEENKKEDMRKEQSSEEQSGFLSEDPDEPEFAAAADTENSLTYMKGKLGKGVVLLTAQQMEDLLEKMGLDSFDYYVERMADFILTKQAKVKNHYATILKWWEEDRSVIL